MKIKILESSGWYKHFVGSEFEINRYDISPPNLRFRVEDTGWVYNDHCVITELPESFCVKRCDDGIKWGKYIDWLNKKCGIILNGFVWKYYGVHKTTVCGKDGGYFGTEIHIDDMIKHIDYLERHIKGGEQFHKESQLTVKMDKEFDLTTDEGRLAYTRKHYPIGTKYIPLYRTGESQEHNISTIDYNTELLENGTIEGGVGFVYANGKWAEIIKEDIKDLTIIDGVKLEIGKSYYIQYKHCPSEWKLCRINRLTVNGHPWSDDRGGIITDSYNVKTVEEFNKLNNMNTQKLSRQGLKEIHSVACTRWKSALEHYGTRNPLEDYIELSEQEVKTMFNECTKEQLPIVSKYLKQDDGSVDVTKFNVSGRGFCDDNFYIIRDREWGEYKKQSFLLSERYDWEIKTDGLGQLCLIPTKKK